MTKGLFESRFEDCPEGLQKGDLVEILLGPAVGKVGLINTIENTEVRLRIGVGLVEPIDVAPELVAILRVGDFLPLDEAPRHEVTRWFNDPCDLKLLVQGDLGS